MSENGIVAFSLLGTKKDSGKGEDRWKRWRPTVGLSTFHDLPIKRLEVMYQHQPRYLKLAEVVANDVRTISPSTEVRLWPLEYSNPWEFEQVYGALHDLTQNYEFDSDGENYLIHISTGSHVAQICLFLLTEYRYFPGRLIQTSHHTNNTEDGPGKYQIIGLPKYARIFSPTKAGLRLLI